MKMAESDLLPICRACLAENVSFQSIFTSDENSGLGIHFAEMIMACASVQITLGDGLPEQICMQCAQKAVQLYLFKLNCEKADAALREKLGKSPFVDPFNKEQVEPFFENDFDINSSENIIVKPEIHLENDDGNSVESSSEGTKIQMCNYTGQRIACDDVSQSEFHLCCEVCDKKFGDDKDLSKHRKIHIPKPFVCETCGKSFTRDDLLLRHKIIHAIKLQEKEAEYEPYVSSNSDSQHSYDTRVVKNSEIDVKVEKVQVEYNEKGDRCLLCKICNKRFSKASHLTRHTKIHAAIKPYICQLCNKGFARAEQLMNHMNAHSGIKPHVCKICSKGFNQISNLRDHMRTHNGEKPFLCSTCGKGFNQLGNLRQHTIRHSGIKSHLCSICGNGFASKGELCAHLRKHTGARPFVCPICNHGFTTSSSLTKHKRIHSGEKPYECEVCKMRFSRSGILARHKRTHTGEKPYICQFCSKAFSQSNDLSSHLRIHTGEKPFICDSCGQAFRQSSALKTHKKTHIDKSSGVDSKSVINHIVHSTFLSSL